MQRLQYAVLTNLAGNSSAKSTKITIHDKFYKQRPTSRLHFRNRSQATPV